MNLEAIVQSIHEEIERLQRARSLLTGNTAPAKREAPLPKSSRMSPEGRARVAAAQKARWAKARRG